VSDTRIALVTGAGRGIGLGIAEAFAAAGAQLHLLDQDPCVRAEAVRLGAQAYVADITDAAAVAAAGDGAARGGFGPRR